MKVSDQAKPYFVAFGVLIAIVFLIYERSTDKFSCDATAKNFKNNEQFHLVLTEKENHYSRDAFLYGIDLNNKERTKYYDGSGWIAENFGKFEVGDTLLKDAGKYTIIIKRGKKTILIPFVCESYVSEYNRTVIHKVYCDTVLNK